MKKSLSTCILATVGVVGSTGPGCIKLARDSGRDIAPISADAANGEAAGEVAAGEVTSEAEEETLSLPETETDLPPGDATCPDACAPPSECTFWTHDEGCTCQPVAAADLTPCDDNLPCTIDDRCLGGTCEGTPVAAEIICNDQNPCTADSCDDATGCLHQGGAFNSAACDDGNPCTQEICHDGTCTASQSGSCDPCTEGGGDTCEGVQGDGLACNGKLICIAGGCEVAQKSKTPCAVPEDACRVAACDADTEGGCKETALADQTLCFDGNPCTRQDQCVKGTCTGEPLAGVSCACGADTDCGWLDDGDKCNGAVACVGGTCKVTKPVKCPPSGTCTVNACDPDVGKCFVAAQPAETECDDENACTENDQCDGSLNGEDACKSTAIQCDHLDDECQKGKCDESEGCVAMAVNDGQACTVDDECIVAPTCQSGFCLGTAKLPADCDDELPCTVDVCDPSEGCKSVFPSVTCPSKGVCAQGVSLMCKGSGAACDFSVIPQYYPVEQAADQLDNNCDGNTDGENGEPTFSAVGCGSGVVAKDFQGQMQACQAGAGGAAWGEPECAPGWHVCTYTQYTVRLQGKTPPSDYWLAAKIEVTGGKASIEDTENGTCEPWADTGVCGKDRSLQARTWSGLWQGIPYAAEAWGCADGKPASSCEKLSLKGAMCCTDACADPKDCDDEDPCTGDTCHPTIAECRHQEAAKPDCTTQGVCAAGAEVVCETSGFSCKYDNISNYEPQEQTCDGLDNDCDGNSDAADEDFSSLSLAPAPPCELSQGVCAGLLHQPSDCKQGAWAECPISAYQAYSVHYSPVETCDGLDNNCDGSVDEVFAHDGKALGAECVGIGACASETGTVICDEDGQRAICSASTGAKPESCNGFDDDCNGQTDDHPDPSGSGCSALGVCTAGAPTCSQGEWTCGYPPSYQAGVEGSCDGLDNDCDGDTDEDFGEELGAACSSPTCQGTIVCNPAGSGVACSTDVAEACDGIDNDCDGLTDEEIYYVDPVLGEIALGADPQECNGLGQCGKGILQCSTTSKKLTCSSNLDEATGEICDGLDNDCDGETDEDIHYKGFAVGMACAGVGECDKQGTVECAAEVQSAICSTGPGGSSSYATQEACDTKDNDCDGDTDEALGVAQSTCLQTGVCALTNVVAHCTEGKWECGYSGVSGYHEANEAGFCDAQDNDCDGSTDEDFLDKGKACDDGQTDKCEKGTYACAVNGMDLICEGDINVPEACDGKDNDCDGATDEPGASGCKVYYLDGDGDGFGTSDMSKCLCAVDDSYTATTAGDCDDGVKGVNPDAKELCDAVDNNCKDGSDEPGLVANDDPKPCGTLGVCANVYKPGTLCVDGTWLACTGETYGDAGVPYQTEETLCDGADNDCDGDLDAVDKGLDGQGPLCSNQNGACVGAKATVCLGGTWQECTYETFTKHAAAYEGASEASCDGKDNDCDGTADEDFKYIENPVGTVCDGIGACSNGVVECAKGSTSKTTCSTNSDGSSPGVKPETCNGNDDDCDGYTDEGLGLADSNCAKLGVCSALTPSCVDGTWNCLYKTLSDYAKDEPELASGGCDGLDNDCNGQTDEDFSVNGQVKGAECGSPACPGVVICSANQEGVICSAEAKEGGEICNGKDDNCDGYTDEGMNYLGAQLGAGCKGVGECGAGTVQCLDPVAICSTNPGGNAYPVPAPTEVCDGLDNDCDGDTDEGFLWQNTTPIGAACGPDVGCKVQCVAQDSATCYPVPGKPQKEACDGFDNDCNGLVDDGMSLADSDCKQGGVCTQANVKATCTPPVWQCKYTAPEYDADGEVLGDPCDNLDNDCNGSTDEHFPDKGTLCDSPPDPDYCANGVWFCTADHTGLECVGDAETFEACGNGDENCDGAIDEEGALGCTNRYQDGDNDGYGTEFDYKCLCSNQGDYVIIDTNLLGDCDDTNKAVNPGQPEWCATVGVDDDCDGFIDEEGAKDCVTYYMDYDQDWYWLPEASKCLCAPSWPYTAVGDGAFKGDCLDTDADVFPGNPETCDGKDNDCDGHTDNGENNPGSTQWFFDYDGDTYGTNASKWLCHARENWTATQAGDCCDVSFATNPGQAGWSGDANGCGHYDYNCDYVDEPQHPSCGYCATFLCSPGWVGNPTTKFGGVVDECTIPACGALGIYYPCNGGCTKSVGQQKCH
jgi:hypothetical protein